MTKKTTIWTILADATLTAAVKHLKAQGARKGDIDAGKLSEALRATLKATIPELLEEWEDMIAANLTESRLRHAVNVQANALAAKAIAAYRS